MVISMPDRRDQREIEVCNVTTFFNEFDARRAVKTIHNIRQLLVDKSKGKSTSLELFRFEISIGKTPTETPCAKAIIRALNAGLAVADIAAVFDYDPPSMTVVQTEIFDSANDYYETFYITQIYEAAAEFEQNPRPKLAKVIPFEARK